MNILLLCEGAARTFDSWSGISQNVVRQLEARGHRVLDRDADLGGITRLAAGAVTFAPTRKRWWVKYHLGALPFALRSATARRHAKSLEDVVDAILQFGATFAPPDLGGTPLFLYCDGNIRLAQAGAAAGGSDAAWLSNDEVEAIARREEDVYRRADRIFCISQRLADSFVEDFGIPESKVSTIYAGSNFDPDRVRPDPEIRRAAPPTILFVGRDFQRKGGDILLESFRSVRARIPEARLTVVGPDSVESEIGGVDVLGRLDRDDPEQAARLEQAYQSATVFCMPTKFEGLSISFLEAMLFGLPCISAYSPWAPPEMIVEGETGFTVPIDDPEALTHRLLELLDDPDTVERLGRAGRQRALELFTWERVVDRMLEGMTLAQPRIANGPDRGDAI